jgi:hypothetical protein
MAEYFFQQFFITSGIPSLLDALQLLAKRPDQVQDRTLLNPSMRPIDLKPSPSRQSALPSRRALGNGVVVVAILA